MVVQAVVRDGDRVLLAVRSDLQGWELPGGNVHPGEGHEVGLRREVREETGLSVTVERHVGDYHRTGFRPHVAKVYLCRPDAGELRTSNETLDVRWFDVGSLPETLFPWYRQPLEDAGAEAPTPVESAAPVEAAAPVERHEYQGVSSILAGMRIDLLTRTRKRDAPRHE